MNRSSKKPRRGRLDRSTSGDERPSLVGGGAHPRDSNLDPRDSDEEVRFDEKGRPIKSSQQFARSSLLRDQEDPDNRESNLSKSAKKVRRKRDQRDSSVSSSAEQPLGLASALKHPSQGATGSEPPRQSSQLPKPA